MHKLIAVLLMLAIAPCSAQNLPLEEASRDLPRYTLPAVANSGHVCAALLDEGIGTSVLDEAGCFVWQQPGVALTVTGVWQPGEQTGLLFYEEKLLSFLSALPNMVYDEPFVHPQEPFNNDEFYHEPQVYILDADQARRRLVMYREGLEMWAGFNEGMDFVIPDDDEIAVEIAVVYIDSSGPLGFYFEKGKAGRLVLRHIVLWDFFSA